MPGRLEGRVAIVTGAGRGLGRAHARFLADQGAAVVVNDVGGSVTGEGQDEGPAAEVARELHELGGRAVASSHDVADWDAAGDLVRFAVQEFGQLDILVNNAGIVRDRTLAKMTEAEWDAVIRVHLKGHAAPTAHAMAYWRGVAATDGPVKASVIHTTSVAGFLGNFGQANYAAAKAGILGLSATVALEGAKIGVRSNAVSPGARTRLSLSSTPPPGAAQPPERDVGDLAPENVSPLIGWLAERDCPATGQVFHLAGRTLVVSAMPPIIHRLTSSERWTPEALEEELVGRLVPPMTLADWF